MRNITGSANVNIMSIIIMSEFCIRRCYM